MIKVNFNTNTLAYKLSHSETFVNIHLNYRILAFCINDKHVAIIEDWEYLNSCENLHIYDLEGNLIFNIAPAPRSLHETGYYTSIGFESENILIAQSADYRYKINLISKEFISEEYTK